MLQLVGTVVALLAGWCAGLLFVEATVIVENLRYSDYTWDAVLHTPITYIGAFIYFTVPVWLLLLVPLYLFVPSSSSLWRWPVCTICGALAGYLILLGFFGVVAGWPTQQPNLDRPTVSSFFTGPWVLYVTAAIVGGVTCFTGSLTTRRFKRTI